MTGGLPSGYTVVVAADLGRDQGAIGRLVAIQVIVGLIVLTMLGVAGYVLVRNSLRPLAEVERTARAIAAGDLSQRVPEGDERTEVGRLPPRSTGCCPGSSTRSAPSRPPRSRRAVRRSGCAASSPTPATNCGRR